MADLDKFIFSQFFILSIGFLSNIAFQFVFCRIFKMGLVKALVLATFVGLVTLVGLEIFIYLQFSGTERGVLVDWTLTNATCYVLASYCFFHFVHISEASLRIRILQEIKSSASGLKRSEVLSLYNSRNIVEARIARLLSRKELKKEKDRFFLDQKKVYWAAKSFDLWKKMVWERT